MESVSLSSLYEPVFTVRSSNIMNFLWTDHKVVTVISSAEAWYVTVNKTQHLIKVIKKATCFGCIKQTLLDFVFQNCVKKEII